MGVILFLVALLSDSRPWIAGVSAFAFLVTVTIGYGRRVGSAVSLSI